ncbi:hypothetical protein C4K11_3302 [Pseudomonas chlororaphis subsp. aureofaciens]|nr:hypothetical protein C4K11_3302 [Pseudomonas chlororaphis subsp. aureofaciens]
MGFRGGRRGLGSRCRAIARLRSATQLPRNLRLRCVRRNALPGLRPLRRSAAQIDRSLAIARQRLQVATGRHQV